MAMATQETTRLHLRVSRKQRDLFEQADCAHVQPARQCDDQSCASWLCRIIKRGPK